MFFFDLEPASSFNSYTALITQTGGNAPSETILRNTFSEVPVFSYISPGVYQIASDVFTSGKTLVLLGFGKAGSYGSISYDFVVHGDDPTLSNIRIYSINTAGAPEDGLLTNASIEIRVYP